MSKNRTAISNQQLNPPTPPLAKGGKGGFESGFTLVELMVTMVMFVLIIAAASQVFTSILTQFKQQTKIAETNIEGLVGLELLRQDIEHAGFGLPWEGLIAYDEAQSAPASTFNDSTINPPRAILSGNDVTFFTGANSIFNGTDYLVIKATNVARSGASQAWTYLLPGNIKANELRGTENPLSGENFVNDDRVIVLSPADNHSLITSGGTFYTTYNNTADFAPTGSEVYVIYGVAPPTGDPNEPPSLRMPFNRVDYYIWRGGTTPATDNVPDRCAFGTGILRKAVLNHNGTFQGGILPLLDCVADMQVVFDNNGTYTDDISALTARQIREQIREVRVYILAHEGQRDVNYTYRNDPTNPVVTVGEFGLGRDFNFVDAGITNWENYRWKVYTLVVKPNNLR